MNTVSEIRGSSLPAIAANQAGKHSSGLRLRPVAPTGVGTYPLAPWTITGSTAMLSNSQRREQWRRRLREHVSALMANPYGDESEGVFGPLLGVVSILTVFTAFIFLVDALSEIPDPDPDCRMQFNNAARYVEHCDFHDGRGYIEVTR